MKKESVEKEHEESGATLSLYDKYLEQMVLIQEKTGIPGNYVVVGLLTSIFFVWFGFLEKFITNLVGTVYPAFWTMKSIESKRDDDKHWLTYWVVFALFTTIDMFSGFILRFIPFYFFLKVVFLIWLFMPNSQGCNIVYHLLVVRVFKSFEQDIDHATGKIGEYTKELVGQGVNMLDNKMNLNSGNILAGVVTTASMSIKKGDNDRNEEKGREKAERAEKKPFESRKKDNTVDSKNKKKKN